ncbi:MAG: hypothetical protein ACYCWA_05740 [Thiobacillus sp.]
MGRVVAEFVPRNDLGVLDHTVTLPSGRRVTNPLRVIAHGEGSETLFTLLQREDMDDARFRQDAALVERDLQTLRRLLEAPAAQVGRQDAVPARGRKETMAALAMSK